MIPVDQITTAIFVGILFLGASLFSVARVLRIARSRVIRRSWYGLSAMVLGFVAGYAVLIVLLPRDEDVLLVNVICAVLVMGGVFVWSVAHLSAQTATDVSRLSMLERDVIVDPLTNVPNRRYFDTKFSEEVACAQRCGTEITLLLIDLDHFKAINDTHGHHTGDRVLTIVGGLLAEAIRPRDILARYGGEEFAIISPQTDIDAALGLAHRLCQRIRETRIGLPDGDTLRVTASIGVSALHPDENQSAFFERTDAALYRAKRGGRNRVDGGVMAAA